MTNFWTSNTHNSLASGGQQSLGDRLMTLYSDIVKDVEKYKRIYRPNTMYENEASRDNLLAYLALRQHNLEDLQKELAEKGLSSLGRLEGQF